MDKANTFILWFNQISIDDVPFVGGKNASLGEMYRNLTKKGVKIPNGFAITAGAYRLFVDKARIKDGISKLLDELDPKDVKSLQEKGHKVRELVLTSYFPTELQKEIIDSYKELCRQYGPNTDVAVRSSATAEDLPDASFAGQQETYLNIRGERALLEACKKCFASLFTNRAIHYRLDKGFGHFKVALSIGVQKMIRSDLASSGVMFSIDTETGFKDAVLINAIYGLGENIVQGRVNPDEYYVFKPLMNKGYNPIISKSVGSKMLKMIYSSEGSKETIKNVAVPEEERKKFVLDDKEIMKLARWACIIEEHYKKPMDMEWAKDGRTNELFIVQARPETVQSQKDRSILEEYILSRKGKILVVGRSVGSKIGYGRAHIIKDVNDIRRFEEGEILVTEITDPDWEPIMKIASGIVTNKGGRTCFTGDTVLLTNKGFKTFEEVFENYDDLAVPSLNKETLSIEWKKIMASMKRKSDVIEVGISQTGRTKGNNLRLTKDHKILTFENRGLISKEIMDVVNDKQMILLAQKIPSLNESCGKDRKLAYLLGAISTDGHIYLTKTHGEVQFIQKPEKEKEEFIAAVQDCMGEIFNKSFSASTKKPSNGLIRGKPIVGEANAYRCYSKQIATQMLKYKQEIVQTLLKADEPLILNFLAGVIDGDGAYNHKQNRINVYCSNKNLLQAIVVGCLRLGIVPQIAMNRTIYNVQIVEKVEELFQYTKRVKGSFDRKKQGTRFFSAKQLLGDIAHEVSYKGRIKPCVKQNLIIDANKIKNNILPLCSENVKNQIDNILNSDTRMQRVNFIKDIGLQDVYNISVGDNHNYVVFTDRLTPVIVNNCHAAIVSRELGIPCIVGTNNAADVIKSGQKITVSCAEGEEGFVYEGFIPFRVDKHDLNKIERPNTKIMMNVGNPEQAFEMSLIPNDGVGLAREEFIINEYIKIHPKALIHFNQIKDSGIKEKIGELTHGYKDKKQFFIERLAHGVARIAAAFYPKDVIVRMSDFKSNEYANLIGGHLFEPLEHNPMIGWRGASRYYSEGYKDAFALECAAMKKVRDEIGLKNVKLMIPFCRTVEEGKKVLKEMEKNGLKRGKNGLEVYVMCEIPSNVILADEFSKIFDGFSIGTNDLTQLTLGLDRDSELVSHIYDERNDAVKALVASVINKAKANKRKIGICGQAPSDYPEFAKFLVNCGIDSISLNPDTVIKTTLTILNEEKRLKKHH